MKQNQISERERVIAERSAQVEVLQKEKWALIKQAIKLLKKPGKRKNTREERFTRAIALIAQAKLIECQQYMIISQPLPRPAPKFKKGRVDHCAVVIPERGSECIVSAKGIITPIKPEISIFYNPKDFR